MFGISAVPLREKELEGDLPTSVEAIATATQTTTPETTAPETTTTGTTATRPLISGVSTVPIEHSINKYDKGVPISSEATTTATFISTFRTVVELDSNTTAAVNAQSINKGDDTNALDFIGVAPTVKTINANVDSTTHTSDQEEIIQQCPDIIDGEHQRRGRRSIGNKYELI